MRRHTHPLCVSMNFAFYRADGRTDQIMIPDGRFPMCCRVILGLNARLCGRADSLSALGLLACITHYRRCSHSSPPCSSLSHTLEWLLVFIPEVHALLASLHSWQSKSPEMIWPHQSLKIIHSASVGLFCIPDSQCDWIFHLHTRLFSYAHASLTQHCHSPSASSIFPFWHFLFCLEYKYEKEKQQEHFLLVISSHQGRKQQSRVLLCCQKYWVAFLCWESTVIAFWYR